MLLNYFFTIIPFELRHLSYRGSNFSILYEKYTVWSLFWLPKIAITKLLLQYCVLLKPRSLEEIKLDSHEITIFTNIVIDFHHQFNSHKARPSTAVLVVNI